MKIKTSFVTNSSTTSFVVMGSTIEFSELFENNKKKLYKYYKENIKEDEVELISIKQFSYEHISGEGQEEEVLHYIKKSKDLDINCDYDSDIIYVGIHYTSMKEDETLKEFKERVKTDIKESFNIDINPTHIEKAWSDY